MEMDKIQRNHLRWLRKLSGDLNLSPQAASSTKHGSASATHASALAAQQSPQGARAKHFGFSQGASPAHRRKSQRKNKSKRDRHRMFRKISILAQHRPSALAESNQKKADSNVKIHRLIVDNESELSVVSDDESSSITDVEDDGDHHIDADSGSEIEMQETDENDVGRGASTDIDDAKANEDWEKDHQSKRKKRSSVAQAPANEQRDKVKPFSPHMTRKAVLFRNESEKHLKETRRLQQLLSARAHAMESHSLIHSSSQPVLSGQAGGISESTLDWDRHVQLLESRDMNDSVIESLLVQLRYEAPDKASVLDTAVSRNRKITDEISTALGKERDRIEFFRNRSDVLSKSTSVLQSELKQQKSKFERIQGEIAAFNASQTRHENTVKVARHMSLKNRLKLDEQVYKNHQLALSKNTETSQLRIQLEDLQHTLHHTRSHLAQFTGFTMKELFVNEDSEQGCILLISGLTQTLTRDRIEPLLSNLEPTRISHTFPACVFHTDADRALLPYAVFVEFRDEKDSSYAQSFLHERTLPQYCATLNVSYAKEFPSSMLTVRSNFENDQLAEFYSRYSQVKNVTKNGSVHIVTFLNDGDAAMAAINTHGRRVKSDNQWSILDVAFVNTTDFLQFGPDETDYAVLARRIEDRIQQCGHRLDFVENDLSVEYYPEEAADKRAKRLKYEQQLKPPTQSETERLYTMVKDCESRADGCEKEIAILKEVAKGTAPLRHLRKYIDPGAPTIDDVEKELRQTKIKLETSKRTNTKYEKRCDQLNEELESARASMIDIRLKYQQLRRQRREAQFQNGEGDGSSGATGKGGSGIGNNQGSQNSNKSKRRKQQEAAQKMLEEKLRAQIDRLRSEISQLKQKNEKYERFFKKPKKKGSGKSGGSGGRSGNIGSDDEGLHLDPEAQVELLQDELENKETEVERMRDQILSLNGKIDELTLKLTEMGEDSKTLAMFLNGKSVDEMIEDFQVKDDMIAELKAQLNQTRDRMSKIEEAEENENNSMWENMVSENDQLRDQMKKLKMRNADLINEKNGMVEQLTESNSKVTQLENTLVVSQKQCQNYHQQLTDAREEWDQLRSELESKIQRLSNSSPKSRSGRSKRGKAKQSDGEGNGSGNAESSDQQASDDADDLPDSEDWTSDDFSEVLRDRNRLKKELEQLRQQLSLDDPSQFNNEGGKSVKRLREKHTGLGRAETQRLPGSQNGGGSSGESGMSKDKRKVQSANTGIHNGKGRSGKGRRNESIDEEDYDDETDTVRAGLTDGPARSEPPTRQRRPSGIRKGTIRKVRSQVALLPEVGEGADDAESESLSVPSVVVKRGSLKRSAIDLSDTDDIEVLRERINRLQKEVLEWKKVAQSGSNRATRTPKSAGDSRRRTLYSSQSGIIKTGQKKPPVKKQRREVDGQFRMTKSRLMEITSGNSDKFRKRPARTTKWLTERIKDIYDKKYLSDENCLVSHRELVPLPEYIYHEYFPTLCGVPELVETHCWDLHNTLTFYCEKQPNKVTDSRMKLEFSVFKQFLQEESSMEDLTFFLRARSHVNKSKVILYNQEYVTVEALPSLIELIFEGTSNMFRHDLFVKFETKILCEMFQSSSNDGSSSNKLLPNKSRPMISTDQFLQWCVKENEQLHHLFNHVSRVLYFELNLSGMDSVDNDILKQVTQYFSYTSPSLHMVNNHDNQLMDRLPLPSSDDLTSSSFQKYSEICQTLFIYRKQLKLFPLESPYLNEMDNRNIISIINLRLEGIKEQLIDPIRALFDTVNLTFSKQNRPSYFDTFELKRINCQIDDFLNQMSGSLVMNLGWNALVYYADCLRMVLNGFDRLDQIILKTKMANSSVKSADAYLFSLEESVLRRYKKLKSDKALNSARPLSSNSHHSSSSSRFGLHINPKQFDIPSMSDI